jgi:ribose 5-phosphate isomerase A
MNPDQQKAAAGAAALAFVQPGSVVGVGTGSTVNHFIRALGAAGLGLRGAVSSSQASTQHLREAGIPVVDAAEVERLSIYVDGADEIDGNGCMIKGGGAALTREKIVADLADQFICIADQSKQVAVLGRFPLPVEVLTMAVPQLRRRFARLDGGTEIRADIRAGVMTDNGHPILDVHGLRITDPLALETEINQWPGVLTVGIFARHRASICLLGTDQGVKTIRY